MINCGRRPEACSLALLPIASLSSRPRSANVFSCQNTSPFRQRRSVAGQDCSIPETGFLRSCPTWLHWRFDMLIGAMNHPRRDVLKEIDWMAEMGMDFIDLTLEPP